MMDVHELLRIKEVDLARIRREVESLRIVAPLLSEGEETRVPENGEYALKRFNQLDDSGGDQNAHNDEPVTGPKAVLFQLTQGEKPGDSLKAKKIKRNWLGRVVGE